MLWVPLTQARNALLPASSAHRNAVRAWVSAAGSQPRSNEALASTPQTTPATRCSSLLCAGGCRPSRSSNARFRSSRSSTNIGYTGRFG